MAREEKTLLVVDNVRRAQNMDQATADSVAVGKFLNSKAAVNFVTNVVSSTSVNVSALLCNG
jgi:hypothetical protein